MKKNIEINALPSEILTHIFSYLRLQDRKHVRLVCPFWYHCCNDRRILKEEKFIFRIGDEPSEEICDFLVTCKYPRPNFEFQGEDMDIFPETVWKHCGANIQSLRMHECRMSNAATKNIILYCSNLEHFCLQSSKHFTTATLQVFHTSNLLNELIQNNIVREKLTSFQLFFDNKTMSVRSDMIGKILKIYPHIEDFGFGYLNAENSLTLLNCPMINSLTLIFPSNGSWMRPFSRTTPIRLQRIEVEIDSEDPRTYIKIINFFSFQTKLKIIRLTLHRFQESSVKHILFHILQKCKNLEELQLTTNPCNELNFEYREFLNLWELVLKLERLRLNFQVTSSSVIPTESCISLVLPMNQKLKIFEWESAIVPKMIAILVFDHCINLQHLVLEKVSDGVLQKLFSSKMNIRTLILLDVSQCSSFGFTGRKSQHFFFSRNVNGYSINNLKKLEHLEICGLPQILSNTLLSEMKFSLLKYLRISLHSSVSRNKMAVRDISQNVCRFLKKNDLGSALKSLNVPSLETLVIDAKPLIKKDIIELCKSSTHLRFLFYAHQVKNNNNYEDLFEASPSLRFIGTYTDEDGLTECYHKLMSGEIRRLCADFLTFQGCVFYQNSFQY